MLRFIFLILSSCFSLASCSENEETEAIKPYTGFNNSEQIVSQEVIPIKCEDIDIMCVQKLKPNYVIRSSEEYQTLLINKISHSKCYNYTPPTINFNKHTLIGYHSFIAGCKPPELEKTITKDTINSYIIMIKVTQIGLCKRRNPIQIWCLIPKISLDAKVSFHEIKETRQ